MAGVSSRLYEERKLNNFKEKFPAGIRNFVPFILETTGKSGIIANQFMSQFLGELKETPTLLNISDVTSSMWKTIRRCLAMGNAEMVDKWQFQQLHRLVFDQVERFQRPVGEAVPVQLTRGIGEMRFPEDIDIYEAWLANGRSTVRDFLTLTRHLSTSATADRRNSGTTQTRLLTEPVGEPAQMAQSSVLTSSPHPPLLGFESGEVTRPATSPVIDLSPNPMEWMPPCPRPPITPNQIAAASLLMTLRSSRPTTVPTGLADPDPASIRETQNEGVHYREVADTPPNTQSKMTPFPDEVETHPEEQVLAQSPAGAESSLEG